MVVAALAAWHEDHEAAARAIEGVTALPAHVTLEAYSVLTRLPAGLAVAPETAAGVLGTRFPDAPLSLTAGARRGLLRVLADGGVAGGSAYHGLVALEAQAHGRTLLTLDRRAQETYRHLAVPFEPLA